MSAVAPVRQARRRRLPDHTSTSASDTLGRLGHAARSDRLCTITSMRKRTSTRVTAAVAISLAAAYTITACGSPAANATPGCLAAEKLLSVIDTTADLTELNGNLAAAGLTLDTFEDPQISGAERQLLENIWDAGTNYLTSKGARAYYDSDAAAAGETPERQADNQRRAEQAQQGMDTAQATLDRLRNDTITLCPQ